jgi:hypothetical protein
MKKIIIVTSVLSIVLLIGGTYKATVKEKTSAILPDKVIEVNGHKQFPWLSWGLVSITCRKGGFNILDYAGKEVTVERSLALGKFYGTDPIDRIKMYVGNEVICEYYVQDTCTLFRLYPGVFAINDRHIRTIIP